MNRNYFRHCLHRLVVYSVSQVFESLLGGRLCTLAIFLRNPWCHPCAHKYCVVLRTQSLFIYISFLVSRFATNMLFVANGVFYWWNRYTKPNERANKVYACEYASIPGLLWICSARNISKYPLHWFLWPGSYYLLPWKFGLFIQLFFSANVVQYRAYETFGITLQYSFCNSTLLKMFLQVTQDHAVKFTARVRRQL